MPGDVPGRLHAAATVAWTLLAVVRPRWGVVLAVPLVLASLAVPSVQDATLSAFVLALVVTIARPRWGWHIGVGLLVILVVANQERAKKGLPNAQVHDTDLAIRVAIDAIRKMIDKEGH